MIGRLNRASGLLGAVLDSRAICTLLSSQQKQVAFIGSGAWATAAARLAAYNLSNGSQATKSFKPIIKMWVREEVFQGQDLTTLINNSGENVKYLPGIQLPSNLVASSNMQEVAEDADVLVICTPHQFVSGICEQLRDKVDNKRCVAVSLTKGLQITAAGPLLISKAVQQTLGVDCSVLMGANIAEEVAKDQLGEGTIGYSNEGNGQLIHDLFNSPKYLCSMVKDVEGVELAGTLKNVVALGAGFVDGLGAGANSKAAIIRHGLLEMRQLAQALFPSIHDSTFLESCGVADLIASCYGGRNRKVAEAFARAKSKGEPKSFAELEADLLKGQNLQGVLTSSEIQDLLRRNRWEADFPLLTVIHAICQGQLQPEEILNFQQAVRQVCMRV